MSEAKLVVAIALVAIACGDEAAPVDAQLAPDGRTFDVPIGDACADNERLCAGGFGVCVEAVCRRQCAIGVPRCAADEDEVHGTAPDGGDRCVCVPR